MKTLIKKSVVVAAAGAAFISFSIAQAQLPTAAPAQDPSVGSIATEAEQPAMDPVSEHLFPPELVLQQAEQLKLDESQKAKIEEDIATARDQMPELREKLDTQLEALGDLLQDPSNSDSAVLAQLDKVLKEERNVKQLHLRLLLRIRSRLTDEQKSTLQDLKGRIIAARALQQRLNQKLQRVQQGLRRVSILGDPPPQYIQQLQRFQELAKEKKIQEAEAELDDLLSKLEGNGESSGP